MTTSEKNQRVQINLDLSPELDDTLNNLAAKMNGDKTEVLLKAIALMEIVAEAKHIWIANDNENPESKVDKPLILSTGNFQSKEDAELERKLRELKFKQELRKDWILFIVRDVVIFSTLILFFVAISSYSLFTQIHR